MFFCQETQDRGYHFHRRATPVRPVVLIDAKNLKKEYPRRLFRHGAHGQSYHFHRRATPVRPVVLRPYASFHEEKGICLKAEAGCGCAQRMDRVAGRNVMRACFARSLLLAAMLSSLFLSFGSLLRQKSSSRAFFTMERMDKVITSTGARHLSDRLY